MKRLAIVLVSLSTTLNAQTSSISDHIVVTASALPESIESTPAGVSIMTRADIDKREAHDVADVLREVPGLAIARTGSPGKSTTLFMRGGSSKQALVLWNGVEMNNAYLSGYNFGQLSTVGVEKVEVIRGPYSALYGSEAVSGVVNVLTSPVRSGLRAEVQGGAHGFRSGAVSGALMRGIWSAHGSVERRSDEGFFANDDITSDTWLAGVQMTPRDGLRIGIMARRNAYDLGIPRNVNATFTEFVPTPNRREEGSERQILVPLSFDVAGFSYELRLADNHRQERFNDPDGPFGAELAFTDVVTRSARGSVQSSRFAHGIVTVGGEVERSEVDHTDSFGLDVRSRSRNARSFFAEDRLSFAVGDGRSLEIAAGARYDGFGTFGSETSPRLAVAFVEHGRKWRSAYGQGFRAPAIGELYAPFFGNVDLRSEHSTNVEIGFDQSVRGATLSVTAFRSDYDDLIMFGATRFENIAQARAEGIELAGSRRFGRFDAALSYTRLKAVDATSDEQLLRRPKNSGSLAIGYERAPFSAHLVVTRTGARPDITDLFPFGTVINSEYTTADLALSYRLAGGVVPFLKIENATDERYEEVFGYPSARRRAIAGVRYTLP